MTFTGYLSTTTAYTSGINLGVVEKIAMSYSGSVDPMSYPDTAPRDQEFYDMSGAQLTVSINGVYTATSWSAVMSWVNSIAVLITGSQYDDGASRYLCVWDGSTYLVDNAGSGGSSGPIHVIVESFDPTITGGDSPSVEYTLRVTQQAQY